MELSKYNLIGILFITSIFLMLSIKKITKVCWNYFSSKCNTVPIRKDLKGDVLMNRTFDIHLQEASVVPVKAGEATNLMTCC